MAIDGYSMSAIADFIGKEIGVTDWITMDQARIDQFAECTEDRQWIHVDSERAKRESPFGATTAHGYLVLALLASMQIEIGLIPHDAKSMLNYGLDRVRFVMPVKPGDRIRNRVKLIGIEPREDGRILIKASNTLELEGSNKPALTAETLALLM